MTEYNGQTITYDRIGNPLTYRDGMTMTWRRGRQLTTLQTEENSIQYKYDSDSIRTSKIVDGVVHTYEYLNGLLMHETRGEQAYDYYYDANGQLYAVSYKLSENDTKKVYYFTHNWRGDIVGIYNGNGDLKATYEYDTWGNVTAIEDENGNSIADETHIANLNPFRYRGYYQDTETGLYYLLSRYYDPVTHRFINADGFIDTNSAIGVNLYAYCLNNPVNMSDKSGNLPFFIVTAAIGAVVGAVAGGIIAHANGKNVWAGIGIGAAAGALVGTGAGMAAGAALAGSITASTGAVVAGGSALVSTISAGGLGAGVTFISNNLQKAVNTLAPVVQTQSSKMQKVRETGNAGEIAADITKNHTRIESLTQTAKYRIPDMLDHNAKILGEVKNYSGKLSYTAQLRDYVMWSQKHGYQMRLYTNTTSFTKPLKQLIDSGVIQIFPINFS